MRAQERIDYETKRDQQSIEAHGGDDPGLPDIPAGFLPVYAGGMADEIGFSELKMALICDIQKECCAFF